MNISKIIKIPNNSTLLYVRHIITIVRGITINKPFVNICEACFLVKYLKFPIFYVVLTNNALQVVFFYIVNIAFEI